MSLLFIFIGIRCQCAFCVVQLFDKLIKRVYPTEKACSQAFFNAGKLRFLIPGLKESFHAFDMS